MNASRKGSNDHEKHCRFKPKSNWARARSVLFKLWSFAASTITIVGGGTVILVAYDIVSIERIIVFDRPTDEIVIDPPATTSEVSPTTEAETITTSTAVRATTTRPATTTTAVPPTTSAVPDISPDGILIAMPEYEWSDDDTGVWCQPPPHIGNDAGGKYRFRFALAKGDDDDSQYDTYAQWDIELGEEQFGSYDVEAWIPARSATADVVYNIFVDEDGNFEFDADELLTRPMLKQDSWDSATGDWRLLDTIDAKGSVRVIVRNSETGDDFRTDGQENARIAVDVIRLRPSSLEFDGA